MHLEITWTFFLSSFTTFVPCFHPNNGKILFIINTDTSHTSFFNHSKTLRARDLKFWENYHHTLCVLCHMSHVTYHLSHVVCHIFFLQSGEVILLRVCYQRGLSGLVFRLFWFKTLSAPTPCAFFQKLDVERYNFFCNWDLCFFSLFGSALFHG